MSPNANSPSVRAPASVSSAASQERAAALGVGLDAAAGLEAQPRALDALAAPRRRHRERHDALGRILVRAREDLAVGQVVAAGRADPAAAADAHAQVGALGHDAQLVDLRELRDEPVLPLALGAPGDDRVGLVELERARQQVAVAVEREAGGLRVGGGRVLRAAPRGLAARVAVDEHVHRAQAARLGGRGARRIDVGELLDVGEREQRDAAVDALVPGELERIGLAQHLVARALGLGLDPAVGQQLHGRMPARLEHAAVHGARERLGRLAAPRSARSGPRCTARACSTITRA